MGDFIPLPNSIKNKKACINVKNDDNKSFMWSIILGLHKPDTHTDRITKYVNYVKNYDWSMLTFPINPKLASNYYDINKFIETNKKNLYFRT